MRTSEILRKAADEIRRRGWHQGDYAADYVDLENCSVCALGALAAVEFGTPVPPQIAPPAPYVRSAIWALEDVTDEAYIDKWNDDPERTVDEVLAKFEEAAQAAEANGD